MSIKTAVVLFNLGGPDRPEAIQPFLFNLFSDPAIIRAPGPVRWMLAHLISRRRAPKAAGIYAQLGGRSPILPETEAQARALEASLNSAQDGSDARVFIAMRYWHPFAAETAAAVKAWGADRVVLLPLYPQMSTTTTASSLGDWDRAAEAAGLHLPTARIGCYPVDPGFVAASARLIRAALEEAASAGAPVRVLFSAHGLPKKIVAAGDPYQMQVERGAAAIVAALQVPGLDFSVCYQSRVGPLEWIGPDTESEIDRAGRDGRSVVLCPIAFVSEHSETLVELDIEYAERAQHAGVKKYVRVPTVSVAAEFIGGLDRLVRGAVFDDVPHCGSGARLCGTAHAGCICR